MRLSAATEQFYAFQNRIAYRAPAGNHYVPISAETELFMRIVQVSRQAVAHRSEISLLQVGTIIYFGDSDRNGFAKRTCTDPGAAM